MSRTELMTAACKTCFDNIASLDEKGDDNEISINEGSRVLGGLS